MDNKQVLYKPGEEPAEIWIKLVKLLKKLEEIYPDRLITGLHNNHKKLGEKVTELYRQLNYTSGKEFLKAYGFSVQDGKSGGRPQSVKPEELIAELKKRYPNGTAKTIDEIKKENPDIAANLKTLANSSNELFGMTFVRYLSQEGILTGSKKAVVNANLDYLAALKERYQSNPFSGQLGDFKRINQDINWAEVDVLAKKNGTTLKKYLIAEGIIAGDNSREELDSLLTELKKRYADSENRPFSISELKQQNADLNLSRLSTLITKVHNLSAKDYLTDCGILSAEDAVVEKIENLIQELKNRYSDESGKPESIRELKLQNPDLPIDKLKGWLKGKDTYPTKYLYEHGILKDTGYVRASIEYIENNIEIARKHTYQTVACGSIDLKNINDKGFLISNGCGSEATEISHVLKKYGASIKRKLSSNVDYVVLRSSKMRDDNEDLKLVEEVMALRGENTKSIFLLGREIIKQHKENELRMFASESREEKVHRAIELFDSCVNRVEDLMDKTHTYIEPVAGGDVYCTMHERGDWEGARLFLQELKQHIHKTDMKYDFKGDAEDICRFIQGDLNEMKLQIGKERWFTFDGHLFVRVAIGLAVVCRIFFSPESSANIVFYRDKWEYRGDYRKSKAVAFELTDAYNDGRVLYVTDEGMPYTTKTEGKYRLKIEPEGKEPYILKRKFASEYEAEDYINSRDYSYTICWILDEDGKVVRGFGVM